MKRVESHRIRPSSPYYKMLREFCHLSKNLYNHANYLIRQAFKDEKKYLSCQQEAPCPQRAFCSQRRPEN